MIENREQKLIDLCFDIGIMISTPGKDINNEPYDLTKLSVGDKADWIAKQLRINGYDTVKIGGSWGILKK